MKKQWITGLLLAAGAAMVWRSRRPRTREEREEAANPVDFRDHPMMARAYLLAREGKLHTYSMNTHMFYYNFSVARYENGARGGSCAVGDEDGEIMDYVRSGYEPMTHVAYRQYQRQLEEAIRALPNVSGVECCYQFCVRPYPEGMVSFEGVYGENVNTYYFSVSYRAA